MVDDLQNPNNSKETENPETPEQNDPEFDVKIMYEECYKVGHRMRDLGLNLARCSRCGLVVMHGFSHSAFDENHGAR